MDGLSGAASVIALIQIAQFVGSALKDYYEDVRDAREDIQKLYDAVKNLELILSSIQDVLNGGRSERLLNAALLVDPSGPLRQSELSLQKLTLQLKPSSEEQRKIGRAIQSLTWPFKKKDIEKTVFVIDRHKSNLVLGIGIENLNLASKHFDISEDIRSEIRAARDDENRRRVIGWLSKGVPDPSEEHNSARARHEATTGSWFIGSDGFKTWLNAENSLLWLNGGAGAGKSILFSTVINHVQQYRKNEPKSAVVYWYFTFADTEKQKVSHVLCSLIADICSNRRDTPAFLQEAYDEANYGRQKPTLASSLAMLREVISGFENIYLLIDALDECPRPDGERRKLLDLIHEIRGWQMNCMHILVTSRREVDIEESLTHTSVDLGIFASIGVEGSHLEHDIKKYLGHYLQNPLFNKWKPILKRDVEANLASRANGMFRLVALQLDGLSKLRAESKIRSALDELPITLDAFYNRILSGVEESGDREQAYTALQWLAFTPRPLSLKELAEAVLIRPEKEPYLNEEDRFLDYKDLLEILPSGLVSAVNVPRGSDDYILEVSDSEDTESLGEEEGESSLSEQETAKVIHETSSKQTVVQSSRQNEAKNSKIMVQFAHFSVKEYLLSTRITHSPGVAADFQINESLAHNAIVQACFGYLLYAGSKRPEVTRHIFSEFPLLHYAANCWPYHLEKLEGQKMEPNLAELIGMVLQYSSQAWRVWAAVGFHDADFSYSEFAGFDDLPILKRRISTKSSRTHPIGWVSALGLSSVLRLLLPKTPNLNAIFPPRYFGTPLHAAARGGHVEAVKILLRAGANVHEEGGCFGHALQAAAFEGDIEIGQLLLEAGADINVESGEYGSALQAASAEGHLGFLSLLLSHGADVNAQGGYFGSALNAASRRGWNNVVDFLLNAGANINDRCGNHGTALEAALSAGHGEVIRLLLQRGADSLTVSVQLASASKIASHYGRTSFVRGLVKARSF